VDLYPIVKFIHVLSDITLFVGAGAQLLGYLAVRRVTRNEQAHMMLGLIKLADRIGVTGAFLTIASGVYMTMTVWSFETSWIAVALGSIALAIGPLIVLVVEPRNKALAKAAKEAGDGPISEPLKSKLGDPMLAGGIFMNLGVITGIVFLMTTKPPLVEAIIAMVVAAGLGAAVAVGMWYFTQGRSAPRKTGMVK